MRSGDRLLAVQVVHKREKVCFSGSKSIFNRGSE